MSGRLSATKALLGSLIVALSLSALIGIYLFVAGDFGEMEIRTLITTLSLSFFSITSLGCTVVLERRRVFGLAVPGLVLSGVGLVWSLVMIWADWDTEFAGKTMVVLVLLAVSFAQSCLLALAPLRGRLRWVFFATVACIFTLAAVLSSMLIFELDDEFLMRLVGVLGILDTAGTLSVPILFRLGGRAPTEPRRPPPPGEQAWQIDLACPRCGHRGIHPVGAIQCPECALMIHVSVEEPVGQVAKGRFQFSLRAMLLVFLLVSLPLGWVGFRIGQLRRQAAVVKALEPLAPRFHRRYGNVRWISFPDKNPDRFDASLLARLKDLPKLENLDLSGMPIADGDLAHLRGTTLKQLNLADTPITDAGLAYLAGIEGLRHVDVSGTAVTAEGAQALTRSMRGVQVTGVKGD